MPQENDVVLIYIENSPVFFARIEDISADHKKDWYHVTLLILKIPMESIVWLIKDQYINGDEFTMNGKKVRIEKVNPFVKPLKKKELKKYIKPNNDSSNVISLFDKKR